MELIELHILKVLNLVKIMHLKLANLEDMTILIRDLLNKLIWDSKEDIKDYVIVYIHRGALNDQRQIPAHLIEKVYVGSFLCTIDDEETIIPFHRILEIRNIRTQEVVYKKRS